MLQLRVLSGKQAGTQWAARRFPVRIGRSAQSHLRMEDEGVWDDHLRLDLERGRGVVLRTSPGALASVNNEPVQELALRNGDVVALGAAKLQFWLTETRQGQMRLREWLTWFGIAAVTAAQIFLIYWLLT